MYAAHAFYARAIFSEASIKNFGNYIRSSTKYSQLKIFSKCEYLFRKEELFFSIQEFLFHKENFFSQTARRSPTPMSLGSSASFRRIVPCRDTSTMESEIPSFRDVKPPFPFTLSPATLGGGKFWILGRNEMCYVAKGETRLSVISSDFQLPTTNYQLPPPDH